MRRRHQGFTLIELMIAVAIIAILAAIAIPQYANLIAKSQEGTVKGNLGTLRSALSVYFGDTDGLYPVDAGNLNSLTASTKYLQIIPVILLPHTTNNVGHPATNTVVTTGVDDGSGFYYFNGGSSQPQWGQVVVNCIHQDLLGAVWSVD